MTLWAGCRALPAKLHSEPFSANRNVTDRPITAPSEELTVGAAVRQRDGVDGARTAGTGHGCVASFVEIWERNVVMCRKAFAVVPKLCWQAVLF